VSLDDVRRDVRNAGIAGAGLDIAYRALNKVTRFMALTMLSVTPETVDTGFLSGHAEHVHRFLSPPELEALSGDPVYQMPPDFLSQAIAKGDRCYAILDGAVLASYGWYSRVETLVTDDLALRFGPEWVYMYKGFTRPEYRGQRLHAIGMAKAMIEYADEGYRGVVSFVEANNFSSLKSCYRMGYVKAGTIVALQMGQRHLIHVGRGCAPFGFGLRPVAPARKRTTPPPG
jgi:hypothetical protein